MSKRQNLLAVWQQIPVANRTVEVNTKTGFSLTAGSYSIRVQDVQRATVTITSTNSSNTATITSVTTTRALALHGGWASGNAYSVAIATNVVLTNATTVTFSRNSGTDLVGDNVISAFQVIEVY